MRLFKMQTPGHQYIFCFIQVRPKSSSLDTCNCLRLHASKGKTHLYANISKQQTDQLTLWTSFLSKQYHLFAEPLLAEFGAHEVV